MSAQPYRPDQVPSFLQKFTKDVVKHADMVDSACAYMFPHPETCGVL